MRLAVTSKASRDSGMQTWLLMRGLTRFRLREIVEKAAGQVTDLIRAKQANANNDVYAVAA